MKLPWNKPELKEKIDRLEASIKEKNREIEKLENMLEAEKARRKKHTKAKQEAEEKINRLNDVLEGLSDDSEEETREELITMDQSLSLEKFKSALRKLGSVKSDKNELVTVYSPNKLSEHTNIQEIKNSIPEEELTPLMNLEKILLFYDPDLGLTIFKSVPFYSQEFWVSNDFKVRDLLNFIEEKKTWVLVSRGNTTVYSEKNGKVEELNTLKSRIDRKHGKGGFSQSRFERKREEQVEQHLNEVKNELKDLEDIYLLGEESLCNSLKGKRLGGFDPNKSALNNFYRPRRLKISSK